MRTCSFVPIPPILEGRSRQRRRWLCARGSTGSPCASLPKPGGRLAYVVTNLFKTEGDALESRIHDLVNVYGLTAEEVQLLWDTVPPRMPITRPPGI